MLRWLPLQLNLLVLLKGRLTAASAEFVAVQASLLRFGLLLLPTSERSLAVEIMQLEGVVPAVRTWVQEKFRTQKGFTGLFKMV